MGKKIKKNDSDDFLDPIQGDDADLDLPDVPEDEMLGEDIGGYNLGEIVYAFGDDTDEDDNVSMNSVSDKDGRGILEEAKELIGDSDPYNIQDELDELNDSDEDDIFDDSDEDNEDY